MAVADRICEAFDKAGISYFIDRQGIGGGFEFPEVLANAIIECKVVLYLASHNSYASKFTNSELTFAFNEKSKNSVLPYIIDGSTMPPALRFVFAGVNWRNIKDHTIETTLIADILKLLGREPKPEPKPEPKVEPKSEPKVEPKPIVPPQPKSKPSRPPRKPINPALLKRVVIAVVALLCLTGVGVGINQIIKQRKQDKYIEAHNREYEIGDYYDDGRKRGVVFDVTADGRHGKIVSLNESSKRLQWTSDESEQKRLIGADDEHNGANNMAKVKQIAEWQKKYPAFAWCADLGEDWYLPAIEELKKFTLDTVIYDAVNRRLAKKGKAMAKRGKDYLYYSSTESVEKHTEKFCAWLVYKDLEIAIPDGKHFDHGCVRAVSAF